MHALAHLRRRARRPADPHLAAPSTPRSSTRCSATPTATTSGRSGSPPATGSAPRSSTRRRSIPYFLGVVYAIFGRDLLIVRIIQALIGSASCVLLGLAGARLFSKRVGLVAGLALALWAPAIFFDSLLQKSVLDMFFMCLALWLIAGIGDQRIRDRGVGCARRVDGGARADARERAAAHRGDRDLDRSGRSTTFRRSTSTADRSDRRTSSNVRRTLLSSCGLAIVFTPVVARNYSIDGGFYLTTSQFGSNFYIGNNPNADGTYASIRFGRGAPEFERLDAKEVARGSGRPHALARRRSRASGPGARSTSSPRSRWHG